jgi:hypothetical protein
MLTTSYGLVRRATFGGDQIFQLSYARVRYLQYSVALLPGHSAATPDLGIV